MAFLSAKKVPFPRILFRAMCNETFFWEQNVRTFARNAHFSFNLSILLDTKV